MATRMSLGLRPAAKWPKIERSLQIMTISTLPSSGISSNPRPILAYSGERGASPSIYLLDKIVNDIQ
jgi:hypothetical protein